LSPVSRGGKRAGDFEAKQKRAGSGLFIQEKRMFTYLPLIRKRRSTSGWRTGKVKFRNSGVPPTLNPRKARQRGTEGESKCCSIRRCWTVCLGKRGILSLSEARRVGGGGELRLKEGFRRENLLVLKRGNTLPWIAKREREG